MTAYQINTRPSTITADSRQVVPGALFLAYPGESADGRAYIADAINNGASAILWEPEGFVWDENWQVENKPVVSLKQEAGVIADQFYASPSSQLWMVGVTGTNGKTSVTQWLGQCFDYLGRQTAVIGTLGNGLLNQLTPTANTTPDALLLQKLLASYVEQKADVVAMEVSSHGLSQGRVNGVQFDVAVLTNLTRDHLDYHGTVENYALAKEKLFKWDSLQSVVLNSDDDFGQAIKQKLSNSAVKVLTYGIDSGGVRASNIRFDNGAIQLMVTTPNGQAEMQVDLVGRFNVYNVLAVLATLLVSDVAFDDAIDAVKHLKPLNGRMQQFGGGNLPLVIVDYAHTPDSLENVLLALKEEAKQALICVFGCGGNRDQGKRPLMGKVASALADSVIVTTDNPRHERAEDIIQAILKGITGECIVEADRAKAIALAIANAQVDDVVLIAGKGHEDYQEIAGEKHHFSDVEQVELALQAYQAVAV
ncbi:MAG: UDP-N-acetylmuramoyl-L-alanyl-D-glutamate--2,6-diaminopimelate ligase [Betaproteobacteria bacterium]|nr:UDP-N-acetylmuramoyl-L-alanyl-D-glutamate--2,6-diaminopimelate ligase [Betaproteobacteria bacterium]MCH9849849.1 UDP-N-acetylmuramoyl-L-alanyl-D-glutamate--2,6-diaminopimelate ligase [Betaproteobacteria bacterium]